MAQSPLPSFRSRLHGSLIGGVLVLIALVGCKGSEPALVATSVAVSPASVALHAIGAVRQAGAAVLDQKGDTIPGAKVIWTSLAASVASVDSTGKIAAVAVGTAQIKAAASTNANVATLVPVTVTQVPASLLKANGDAQTGPAGSTLSTLLTVRVNDSAGVAVAGVIVTFTVTQGGGSVTAADTTAGDGLASASLQLGPGAGTNIVSAAVSGTAVPPVFFTETGTAGGPTSIVIQAGDGQSAHVGTAVATAPAVLLQDSASNPVPGVIVTFAVASGGGTVTKPVDTTGVDGIATVGAWTLGSVGTNTLTASVSESGVSGNPVTFTATGVGPASIVIQAGDGQSAHVGTAVATAPSVLLQDSASNPVPKVIVTFAVASGGGIVTKSVDTTGVDGIATVGAWTLGSVGTNTLTASVSESGVSGNPVTFTATGIAAGAPTQVVIDTGNGQTGLAGYPLNVRPAVRVLDASGGPVQGASVSFSVASGGGSVTGPTQSTGLFGVAAVGSWTVQFGSNSLTATVSGSGITGNPVTFAATGDTSKFQITLRYLSTISASRQAVFDSAAARWERLVIGDLPDIALNVSAGNCGNNSPAINETVDDILIFVTVDSIDGPGKILGQASPCYIRSNGFLPIAGFMQFDSADVASLQSGGELDEVIIHEMGHILGFGTIWGSSYLNLLVDPTALGGTDPHFVGAQALQVFDDSGGANYSGGAKVPVENCIGIPGCGASTYDGHWRESVFDNELMTGYINAGANPLSAITVAAMGDEGYLVNYAASDPYTVVNALAAQARGAGAVELKDDIVRVPIYMVDSSGRVVRVIHPR